MPEDTDVEAMLRALTDRLRGLREERGHTLTDVAGHTGLSLSTLSRLESGHRRPTLDLLIPLARLYQVRLDDIVGTADAADPRVELRPIRRGSTIVVPLSRRTDGLVPFKSTLPGRTAKGRPKQVVHAGFEWCYVLDGVLALWLGDTVHRVEAGEAVEFDTLTPHALVSATAEPVELLNLLSPQGQHVHVRSVTGATSTGRERS